MERKKPSGGGGRSVEVKNKAPAPVQTTAEQLLRIATELQEREVRKPNQAILDPHELAEYQYRKRKQFEERIRMVRDHVPLWIRYAEWEERQNEFERARSIFERAIDLDFRFPALWIRYAEMEMRNRFVNHARNIFERAVGLLPRIDQLWLKYSYMEEVLGNVDGARTVFQRWMEWEPDESAWNACIQFEFRNGSIDHARDVYRKFVQCHNNTKSWIRYASFEEKRGTIENARKVFESAVDSLGEEFASAELYSSFAAFEERQNEFDRARVIFKYALDKVPKKDAEQLFIEFSRFEKRFGDKETIEDALMSKRRFEYEDELKKNAYDYDVWFDYIRLEEEMGSDPKVMRELFERAVAMKPSIEEKVYWRRYIYLWIQYAMFEEVDCNNADAARSVLDRCLDLIPHKKFSFSKLWIMTASLEIRRQQLTAARRILGRSLGVCAKKTKIFEFYIDLEQQLGNLSRCRTLFEKYVEDDPSNCDVWIRFANMETEVAETDRARAILELGVSQDVLDRPETLWRAYIDFEIEEEEFERVRSLYERLLEKTNHVKVWIRYAEFEAGVSQDIEKARTVFERADTSMKGVSDLKENRVMLISVWRDFEKKFGDEETLEKVKQRVPKRVQKRRPVKDEEGHIISWEEYVDYEFPDEEKVHGSLKILEMARKWKREKKSSSEETSDESAMHVE